MIHAECFGGHYNERPSLDSNLKCDKCGNFIPLDDWETENGMPANMVLDMRTCRTCGKEFKGEHWKTKCIECFNKQRFNRGAKRADQEITNS